MKYQGIELKEFTSDKSVVFDPPKKMLVWDDDNCRIIGDPVPVYAYIPDRVMKVVA